MHRNLPRGLGEPQRIVAGRQSAQFQEALLHGQRGIPFFHEPSATDLQQRGGGICARRQRHTQRIAPLSVQRLRQGTDIVQRLPGSGHRIARGHGERAHTGERAQPHAPLLIGLQIGVDGLGLEIAVTKPQMDRLAGQRFAVLAAQVREMAGGVAPEIERACQRRPLHAVEGKVRGVAQLLFLIQAQVLDLGVQGDGECDRVLRHLDLLHGLGILAQREIRKLLSGHKPLQIGRAHREACLFQQLQADRLAVDAQERPDSELCPFAADQRLAVHIDSCRKRILLGQMVERDARSETPVPDDQMLRARCRRKRHQDAAVFTGREGASAQPARGVGHAPPGLVEHRKRMPGCSHFLQHVEPSLLHQRAAALAVPDQLHHIDAALPDLGKLEGLRVAPLGGLRILDAPRHRGHEPVEIHGQIERPAGFAVVVESVDLVNLHEQGRHVFERGGQAYRGLRGELGRIRFGEFDIYPLLEARVGGRRQQRHPVLRLADAVDDLRLREERLEKVIAQIGLESAEILVLLEKLQQEAAHQRLFLRNRRQGDQLEILIEPGELVGVRDAVAELGAQGRHLARQLEILHEPGTVENTLRQVMAQPVVEHVRLERVVRGLQRAHIGPEPLEVGLSRGRIGVELHFVSGHEHGQVSEHKGLFVAQARHAAQQVIQLRQRHPRMHGMVPETPAAADSQVGRDQLDQIREVGTPQARQQVAPLLVAEPRGGDERESVLAEPVQRTGVAQGQVAQRARRERRVVEA